MFTIERIKAREILDSRGNPTVEVDVQLKEEGAFGRAAVPSGASTGSREALELRDGDKKRFLGKGVLKAVGNVNEALKGVVEGKKFATQEEFDAAILKADGTENKSKLGANALLGASMAFCRAASVAKKVPLYDWIASVSGEKRKEFILPVPMMNIFNGGAHANNGIDFQEFMVLPVGGKSFSESLRMGVEVFHRLKGILHSEGLSTAVGDEGGFASSMEDYEDKHEQVLEFIMQAIEEAGYKAGKDIYLGLDVAASEFFNEETQKYSFEGRKTTAQELLSVYEKMKKDYPILSIEDGMAEGDKEGWKILTKSMAGDCQLVGDDVFVTNQKILKEGISAKIANSVLVKVNQIGTLSETIATVKMATAAKYTSVISHRSGETEDSFIADLAVGLSTGQIKTGSASRSDRMAKYNQLLRIEEELGRRALYNGLKSIR